MKQKKDKASLLTTGVVILLCVFFVGGFIWGLSIVTDMEGTYPPVVNEEGITPAPENGEEALAFLEKALSKVEKECPKTETGASFSIDADSVETDGSAQFAEALSYIRGSVEGYLSESVEKLSTEFYQSTDSVLRLPGITPDRISSIACDYIYYECSSCGRTSDEPLDNCETCGNELPYNLRYTDNYRIHLYLDDLDKDGKTADECFAPREKSVYMKLANDALEGRAELSDIDIGYSGLEIYFEINRLTDKLVSLSYIKPVTVSFDATDAFTGDWSRFGGGKVKFTLTEKYTLNFTWPALTLNEHYMSIEPKGNDNLLATLTCDNPTEYTVTWVSSDESIVKVDDEGYFDAGKHQGKAVITASYEFGGITYSDECEIEVKNSVERLGMKHKKVRLSVGETEQLSVSFKPKNATIQTLKWYSPDESIATVDENGTVRGVAPGVVKVYCLSDDGYYKSTCEVTVE